LYYLGVQVLRRALRTARSKRGQTLVEYGLLVALIAVVVIVALLFLGPIIRDLFNNIGNTIQGT
jgi:pilus assembly protein Flp/PilA